MQFWHSVKDNWPQIVKYLSTIFAAYYGLYATLNDFHSTKGGRKTRQLSAKGYVGIALLGVATALSLFADINKDRKDRAKSDADDTKIQGITTNLVDELGKTEGIRTQVETQLKGTETLKTVLDSSLAGQRESSRTLSSISSGLGRTLADQKNSARTLTGISAGLSQTLDSEHKLAQDQKQLQLQSIRSFYPLEPITILYQVEYPMDQPAFAAYLKRVTSGSSRSELSIGDPSLIPADVVVRLENGLDLPPFLTQPVKTQNPLNGELSHGIVTQAVHQGVQAGRCTAAGSRRFTSRSGPWVGSQPQRVGSLAARVSTSARQRISGSGTAALVRGPSRRAGA
jgi:hypothetical protein